MLKDYPTYFDNIEILRPVKWDEDYEVIEDVNETEAGTDVVVVTRRGKLTVSASYKVSSVWAKKFMEFSEQDTIAVKIYDAVSDGYKTYTMRMRRFKKSQVKGSEFVRYGNGVYNVSFDLIQF